MLTLSRTEGIGGIVKSVPEDFIVEEIMQNGKVLEMDNKYTAEDIGQAVSIDGKFATFILQKRDWNTVQALKMIARRSRRGIKSVGFAGTKDRTSVSTQLCSIFGATPEELMGTHIKDISINGAWRSNAAVRLGDLSGNRFTITVREVKNRGNIEKINGELSGIFPNYFGEQRFGIRNNNVDVGVSIIKGDFENAAMRFLTDTTNEKNLDAIAARKRLAEEKDFKKAMEYFPEYLRYERQVIGALAMNPTDHANAIRKLPRSLTLMFVHSVESHIFNMEVEKLVENRESGPDMQGNIIGYDNEINELERELLAELGLTQEQFRVKSMPELNCKGTKRLLFAPYSDFSHSIDGEGHLKLRFSLQAGSYATVLMNEFLKN